MNNSPANSSMSNNSNNANSANNDSNNVNNPAMADDSAAPRLQSVTATDINALAEDLSIVANVNNSNDNDSNSNNNINN
ncbi:hypothetical protein [Streptomyces sp. NPDC058964]|uniref:hypothetical protein n=1 Tax=Streptomyces sp. NPDC058964 TaxID=3346681 RepID=UPI0036B26075